TVVLTVRDAGGLTGTTTRTVTVTAPAVPPPANRAPVADFTVSCSADFTCTFDGRGSTDDQGVVSWDWDVGKFPDPTASGSVVTSAYPHRGPRRCARQVVGEFAERAASGAVVTSVYPHGGPRTVTLTVRDAGGLTSTTTRTFNPRKA